jgi:protein-tyrosine-phosphatase
MCEGYFRYLCRKAGRADIEVESAGLFAGSGCPVSEYSALTLKRLGVDISSHKSSQLTIGKIQRADLIVGMTSSHVARVGGMMPSALGKTRLLLDFVSGGGEVADPVGGGADVYDDCFGEMKPALENLFLDLDKILK